jgi:hypothetical protein
MGSMAGTFTIPEFNSSHTITDSNLVRIGVKKILEKKHVPFYLIFSSENHLNAHSSLIKPHMAMNFAPLDCSCQGASSEPKKNYLNFSVLEKFAKNHKSIFLAPTVINRPFDHYSSHIVNTLNVLCTFSFFEHSSLLPLYFLKKDFLSLTQKPKYLTVSFIQSTKCDVRINIETVSNFILKFFHEDVSTLFENFYELLQNLKVESWCQKASMFLPYLSYNIVKKKNQGCGSHLRS